MKVKVFDHQKLEGDWQERWLSKKIYMPDLGKGQKPFYNLMMFPYPSAEGLHVGNMYAFTGADLYGRYKRMLGYQVFEPIGLDGFGIHSENYAIKVGKNPLEQAKISEKNFYRQLSEIGNGYAWNKRLETYDPDYYRWTQWLFIKMYKKGLVYRGKAMVNWCPNDKTVLADEQVINGCCERCGTKVERKEMTSWYFKITDYAGRLLSGIDKIDWPESIKTAQRQWIGKSEGARVKFKLADEKKVKEVEVFTTRLDTIFGATFIVISPELASDWQKKGVSLKTNVKNYIKDSLNKTEQDRKEERGEKTGVDTGIKVFNPASKEEIPVWVASYVLADVGTGAIMAVPAHDKRDFEFAKKFGLKIQKVIKSSSKEKVFVGEGKLISSGDFSGLDSSKARKKLLEGLKEASQETTYHLRDWLISRQRYWGPPIPMVHCDDCGWNPVDEKDLPVYLPEIADFKPKGDGTSPLANAPDSWKTTKCPNCGGKAKRELDVSDTFLDSSWYFLAFPNMGTAEWKSGKSPFSNEILKKWLPVDSYIGGAEHAVLHLLYARFVAMALKDMGYLSFEEPFPFLYGHGLLIKDGAKMSKSKGNIIVPDDYIAKFGADTLRAYLMFLGPFNKGGDFSDTGIEGMHKFLKRVWVFVNKNLETPLLEEKEGKKLIRKTHQTIKKVTNDFENFRFNTALSSIMELFNELKLVDQKGAENIKGSLNRSDWKFILETFVKLLAPFAPYMTEEIWVNILKNDFSLHQSAWPRHKSSLAEEKRAIIAIQINGKLRGTIKVSKDESLDKEKIIGLAKNNPKVEKWIKDSKIIKEIFVPGKLVNFVV